MINYCDDCGRKIIFDKGCVVRKVCAKCVQELNDQTMLRLRKARRIYEAKHKRKIIW